MIIFISDGRLGNQLFQYAFLRTIAKKNEKIITISMDIFKKYFEVNNHNFKNMKLGKYVLFFVRKILRPYFLMTLVKLRFIGYIKQDRNEISALPGFKKKLGLLPIIFVETDFFQSESFFEKDKLDFGIKQEYFEKAQKFLEQIPKVYTNIFVHIRRTDYLSESYLGEKGINLPKNYYEKAIKEIAKGIQNPFFIFLSDDPEFVECCFPYIQNKIISKNDAGTDLAIMSLCEYGIVSNSSFAWWGAYLMKCRKRVIFPKYWYGWKQKIQSHIGIYPKWADVIEVE
ncbi:alpha-1,2-fucosyltransferase [Thermodesulfovibrio yellowstonii]|uniref:Alpha-1,2-fucosyltransferase n=1 Tax=Thermodesulfovibrio yellowstonii TaxID=28262 RepID=A0A9W6LLB3_9BACT|nr:alpha-1,2-fucosyltransferase [Thermodesulfovibrio islandicus]GLI54153.1 alpha-1,2-fucosyltransferase [Thermodesulfovibrio islandicus]